MSNKNQGKQKPFKLTPPPDKPPRVPKRDIDRVLQAHADSLLLHTQVVAYHCATDRNQVRSMILKFGVEKTIELAAAYPTIGDGWLLRQGYPLRLLDRHVNAVQVKLQGLAPRKKRDPRDICIDPNDPGWNDEL